MTWIRRKKIGRWHIDKEATAARGFTDHRSYVGQRIHPETNHQCVYLFGDDVTQVRRRICERERGRCWRCGAYYGFAYGELRHLEGGYGPQRCFCDENLGWGCGKCHVLEHGRYPRSGKVANA